MSSRYFGNRLVIALSDGMSPPTCRSYSVLNVERDIRQKFPFCIAKRLGLHIHQAAFDLNYDLVMR